MELMTREMEGKLKSFPFYSQDGKGDDAIVVMKFFNPYGLGTWYVLEAEKQENTDWELGMYWRQRNRRMVITFSSDM